MGADELGPYVSLKLREAGQSPSMLESDALAALGEATDGLCRQVDRLCRKVLALAESRHVDTVNRALVESAANAPDALRDRSSRMSGDLLVAGELFRKMMASRNAGATGTAEPIPPEYVSALSGLKQEVETASRSREDDKALLQEILRVVRRLRVAAPAAAPAPAATTGEAPAAAPPKERIPFDQLDKILDQLREEQDKLG
jgi:hypothetical protein